MFKQLASEIGKVEGEPGRGADLTGRGEVKRCKAGRKCGKEWWMKEELNSMEAPA